jgi:hypothetical protein
MYLPRCRVLPGFLVHLEVALAEATPFLGSVRDGPSARPLMQESRAKYRFEPKGRRNKTEQSAPGEAAGHDGLWKRAKEPERKPISANW